MRIGILEKVQQPTDFPRHFSSKKLADTLVSNGDAVWCGRKRVQLTSCRTWAVVKLSYTETVVKKPNSNVEVVIPRIKPYRPEEHWGLMLHYPPTDQTSYAKANFIRVWGSNQRQENECQQ